VMKALFAALLLASCGLALSVKNAEDDMLDVRAAPKARAAVRSADERVWSQTAEDLDDMRRERRKRSIDERQEKHFDEADTNKDGVLSVEEYRTFYRKPLERLEDGESKRKAIEASDRMRGEVFERLDKDHNGALAKGEWDKVFSKQRAKLNHDDGAFEAMMEDEAEAYSPGRIQKRLRKDGRLLHLLRTDAQRDSAFAEADADQDKTISLDELQAYMAKPHVDMEREQVERSAQRDAERKTRYETRKQEHLGELESDITTAHDETKHHERSEAESTMRKSLDEHTAKMEQARQDFDAKFAARQKEIEDRMVQAKDRMRSLRARQVERTFKHYDRDRDGKITADEWHTAIKKSSAGAPDEEEDEQMREALRKEASGTGASSL